MSLTKNKKYPVYGLDENTGTFISFRTSIAGTGADSAIVKIDNDINNLELAVEALQENGCTIENVAFKYSLGNNGAYIGGEKEITPNSVLIFSIDDNSVDSEIRLKVGNMSERNVMRYDCWGNKIAVLGTDLVIDRPYFTYYDGEYFLLIGCVVNEGEAGDMIVTVSGNETETKKNIESGDSIKTVFEKLRKWFTSFGSLAWKDTINGQDIDDETVEDRNIAAKAISNTKLSTMTAKTVKGNLEENEATPQDITIENLKTALDLKCSDLGDFPEDILHTTGGVITGDIETKASIVLSAENDDDQDVFPIRVQHIGTEEATNGTGIKISRIKLSCDSESANKVIITGVHTSGDNLDVTSVLYVKDLISKAQTAVNKYTDTKVKEISATSLGAATESFVTAEISKITLEAIGAAKADHTHTVAEVEGALPIAGGTMEGDLDITGHSLTVANPEEDSEAANKKYVDDQVSAVSCETIGAQEIPILKDNDSVYSMILEIENNAEYDYTNITQLTIKGNMNSAHGFITFGSTKPVVNYDTSAKFIAALGDDITTAAIKEVWEFDTLNGRIIWKNWGAPV